MDTLGHVDLPPRENRLIRNEDVLVAGWALVDEQPATSIGITVNGALVAIAETGIPRPDVASGFRRPEIERCGFAARINLEFQPSDEIAVGAVAFTARGSAIIDIEDLALISKEASSPVGDLQAILDRKWYYSVELAPGVVAKGYDYDYDTPLLPRITLKKCDLVGMDCLDMGSMEGLIPVLMTRGGARSVLGTDFDDWCSEKMAAVQAAYGTNFEFKPVGLMHDIHRTLAGRSFDLINCSGLLYHVWSPMHVIASARSLLRPNGMMIISTMIVLDENPYMDFNRAGQVIDECNTFWFLSAGFLEYALRYLRLEPIDIEYMPYSEQRMTYDPTGRRAYVSVLCRATEHSRDDPWMASSEIGSVEYRQNADWSMADRHESSTIKLKSELQDFPSTSLLDAIHQTQPTPERAARVIVRSGLALTTLDE